MKGIEASDQQNYTFIDWFHLKMNRFLIPVNSHFSFGGRIDELILQDSVNVFERHFALVVTTHIMQYVTCTGFEV